MSVRAIVGLQWGDEGKGKTVDELAARADFVVRGQGGDNAGHTVVVGSDVFKLHLLPSGIIRETVTCVIANGVVVNPLTLCAEVDELEGRGLPVLKRLVLSDRAHMLLPYHRILDGLREAQRGKGTLGTTKRGIGPAYADKARRSGLRWHHARDPGAFADILRARAETANREIRELGGEPADIDALMEEILPAVARLRPCITDSVSLLQAALDGDRSILLEGAQGAMLDIDFGTYPYLTSSNTTIGGLITGTGIPPQRIDEVHGILKAFTTRVGAGPFPTELTDERGDLLRGTGENQWDEFGTTTGRPRRCGWLDLVVGRYAARINGVTHLHITKLDVLSAFDELKVCTAYELDGRHIETYPASLEDLARCKPKYETLPGWEKDLSDCTSPAELPEAAWAYLRRIGEGVGVPVATVSFGPGRGQTLPVG